MVYPSSRVDILQTLVNQVTMVGHDLPWLHGGYDIHNLLRVPVVPGKIYYLLTYDSYGPVHNRFHWGEWIMRASGGEGALDTLGPLNGTSKASAIYHTQGHKNQWSIGSFM